MDEISNGYNQMEADVSRITQETNEFLNQVRREIEGYKRSLDDMGSLNRSVTKDAPLVISFVGKFKTGKSSLINALLGEDILPTRATTATAIVTRIFRGPRKEAWVRENGREESVSIEKAQEMILNHQVEDIENPTEIIIKAPISWLSKDVELRDTPGMDDDAQNGALEAVTLKALKDTDVCICVYDASSMMSEKERERTVKIHRQMGGNVVYTINCTNRLNSIKRIQEVENFSNSFFGSFESEISGMGKVYMMCSAPGMVDLDGFDEWLKELTKSDFLFSRKSRSFRSNIRFISMANQIAELQREISVLAGIQVDAVLEKLGYLEEEHKRILKEKHFQIRKNADEKVNELNEIFPKAIESLSSLDNLSERLEKCLDEKSWKKKYAKNSANVVRKMFLERYEMICNDYDGLFEVSDSHYIDDMMEFMDFPGSHFVQVPAESKTKWGFAIIGLVIGIAGLIPGMIIGAALGYLIGCACKGKENQSVSNTMSFVHITVLPRLSVGFQDMQSNSVKRFRQQAQLEIEQCTSGLETFMSDGKDIVNQLRSFNISEN